MASKRKKDYLTFKWTAPKGLLTIAIFLALAIISEYLMVSFFAGSGLTEIVTFGLPFSPLFHLLPLTVILVLVSTWMYLTKHIAIKPHRRSPFKVSKIRRKRTRRKPKSTQSIMGKVKTILIKIRSVLPRFRGVSFAPKRISFGRVVLESTLIVLTVFQLSIILLSVFVYPHLFTDFAAEFYRNTSPLQSFMQSVANTLVEIASGLDSIAPDFREAFETLVSAGSPLLNESDLLWRYVFCQNAAAWVSAIVTLSYVRYSYSTYQSSK
jgi:hypothetical protein